MNLIEECIGYEPFLKLRGWVGGSDYYVPRVRLCEQGEMLASKIGEEAAAKLMTWAGGSVIYVITDEEAEIDKRREAIKAMRRRGLTRLEIAQQYTYTARYSVKQIGRLLSE